MPLFFGIGVVVLPFMLTQWNCFFEPSVKMEIAFRKLGVQRIREMLGLVFGLWAFLPFSNWESPRRNKKYSDFRGRKISFNLHNQEVQRTRISLIQY